MKSVTAAFRFVPPAFRSDGLRPWLIGLLLFFPSANYHLFSGVPWNSAAQLAAVALAAPLLLSRRARRAYRVATREGGILGRRAVRIACGFGILGKVLLLTLGGYEGFLGSYRSPAAPPVSGTWEKSYSNPFVRFGATRIDRTLDFGPIPAAQGETRLMIAGTNWNLSFLNSLRFNFYPWVKGNVSRDRIPLAAEWGGVVEGGAGRDLAISYVGEGEVEVGSVPRNLPREYRRINEVVLSVPAGEHRVRISYRFDDGYRTGDPGNPGPYAALRCVWRGGSGAEMPLRARRAPWPWRAAAAFVDGLVLLVLATIVRFYAIVLRGQWRLLGLIAILGPPLSRWTPMREAGFSLEIGFVLAIAGVLLALAGKRGWRTVLLAYVAVLYLSAFRKGFEPWNAQTLHYRSAGNDFLSYESFARSILDTGSLEAQEKVFSNQPLSRYVNFVLHMLFGDGDAAIASAGLVLLNTGIFWAYLRFRARSRAPSVVRACQAAAAILLVALAASPPVVTFVAEGASEAVTWIALMFWFPRLFDSTRTGDWIVGAILVGLSVGARANHIPALLAAFAVFAVGALRSRPAAAAGAGAAALGFALLPAWHNWHYGHRFVLFTYTYALNTAVAPSALLRLGRDAGVRSALRNQLEGLFYLAGGPEGDSMYLKVVLHSLQILWLAVAVGTLLRRRAVPLQARLLLLLPFLYMAPHVFFFSTIYYPRHIISPHLAMGIVSMYALKEMFRGNPHAASPPESSAERNEGVG